MQQLTVDFALLLGVIIGLVEVAKRLGLPDKMAPLLSVIIGVGLEWLLVGNIGLNAVLNGLVIGLSAVGLFSSAKNVGLGMSSIVNGRKDKKTSGNVDTV